jgi:hypothetical protein
MPGPEPFLFHWLPPVSGGLLAYGPAPGMELIPYFLGLAFFRAISPPQQDQEDPVAGAEKRNADHVPTGLPR